MKYLAIVAITIYLVSRFAIAAVSVAMEDTQAKLAAHAVKLDNAP